jgi:hypothetical protein
MQYIDITGLLIATITVILGVAARYAVPYLKEKWGEAKFNNIVKWVRTGVRAAEMIYRESGMGEQKKAYVIEYLHSLGFNLDFDVLSNLIESEVLGIKKEAKNE